LIIILLLSFFFLSISSVISSLSLLRLMISLLIDFLLSSKSETSLRRLFNSCFSSFAFLLMLSWAVMISLCHADMRLPGYLSWNVSFDGADLSAPSRKELVHTSMLCQHFKRRDDGTGICLFHSAVMPEAFLIPEEICQ